MSRAKSIDLEHSCSRGRTQRPGKAGSAGAREQTSQCSSGAVLRDNSRVNARLASLTAFGRVGLPDDAGEAVAALLSDGNG